jgi:hypothetical protein
MHQKDEMDDSRALGLWQASKSYETPRCGTSHPKQTGFLAQ